MVGEWRGRRVVVMGLGRFGGGIGVARWLAGQGARVLVTDQASEDDLRGSIDALGGLPIEFRLGRHDPADLEDCDLLVASPAVNKATSEFFQTAVRRGVPWSSEMNLFLERCPARLVGITGSVGKSTTTAMVGAILAAAEQDARWSRGRVWLGGNIGKSLLDGLPAMKTDDVVVLELSSFQLEDAVAVGRSPHYALITNLRENHLDRHGTMRAYAAAKANVYRFQQPGAMLALPAEGCGIEWLPDDWQSRFPRLAFEADVPSRTVKIQRFRPAHHITDLWGQVRLSVPGGHNLWNAAAAITIAEMLEVPPEITAEALRTFAGLPHRLEFVRELDGVRYFNDSKATTPDAAITALEAFDRPAIMLVGGSDKGSSFAGFGKALAQKAKVVIALGATREKIVQEVRKASQNSRGPIVHLADGFVVAVEQASRIAERGDVVVLSPGCASYDMFKNYEERGDTFRQLVNGWQR